jgi:hypothetical protein
MSTGRYPLTEIDARTALAELTHRAHTTGRAPSVLALARHLGIPNTTLRRRFPAICIELTAARRAGNSADDAATDQAAYDKLVAANA